MSGLVDIDLDDALADGDTDTIPARYATRTDTGLEYSETTLTRAELVPNYLKLDQLYLRLFVAARAVNRVRAEAGLQLSYDDSAVCHWLAGTLPRDRVRPVVCEALSRRLGRPVTPASAGLGAEQYEDAADTVAGLIDLGSADTDPSTTCRPSTTSSAAYRAPHGGSIPGQHHRPYLQGEATPDVRAQMLSAAATTDT
ncbi:MAG: hypothetical protein ACRDS1_01955 [Pseudonocardiaceae bacterium]